MWSPPYLGVPRLPCRTAAPLAVPSPCRTYALRPKGQQSKAAWSVREPKLYVAGSNPVARSTPAAYAPVRHVTVVLGAPALPATSRVHG